MTREEAMGQLKFMLETMPKEPPTECDYIEEWLNTDKDIRNALNIAIEALEQTRWIPVSERFPEKNMVCLVSVGKLHLTQIAMYSDLMQTIDHKIFYQGDYGHDNFRDITEYVNKWMPLPKDACKAESEK